MLIIGAGRGGGHVAERLAAAGQRDFAILDADRLEDANVPAHVLGRESVGRFKARELAVRLAGLHDASVRFALVPFGHELLDIKPLAEMIYHQDLILALTDDQNSQLDAAVTAARLEIPLVTAEVDAEGGADLFVQFDVNRAACYACFTAHRRRNGQQGSALRGRDLQPGWGQSVDAWTTRVALALLNPSSSEAQQVFAPHPERGLPNAWRIPPPGQGDPQPMVVARDRRCPLCGDEARRARGAPADPVGERHARERIGSLALISAAAAAYMVMAGLFGVLLAHRGSAHWVFFHKIVNWCMTQSHDLGLPLIAIGIAALGADAAIRQHRVARPWAEALCYGQMTVAGLTSVPVVLLLALMAITIAVWALVVGAVVIILLCALTASG